jgi:predicted small metal-binding protein
MEVTYMAVKEKELKKVECSPECGFVVQDHDEKELIEIVKHHVKKAHGKKMKDDEVRGMIKPA